MANQKPYWTKQAIELIDNQTETTNMREIDRLHTIKISWEEALAMLNALEKQEERLKEDDLKEKVAIEKLKNKIYDILPHIWV